MTHPRRWFYPIYALLFALVLTVAYVGRTSAKSSRQATTSRALSLIERTVLPTGDINRQSNAAGRAELQLVLGCERNDIYSALGKAEPLPECAGTLPTPTPTTTAPPGGTP